MLRFATRHIRTSQSPGTAFRAAPAANGGGMCPGWFNTNGMNQDFCVIGWVKPTWGAPSQFSICGMLKGFEMKTTGTNTLDCRIAARDGTLTTGGANQNTQALTATTVGALVVNEWNLVAMSFNATSKILTATVFNSANLTGSAVNSAAYSVVPPTQAEDSPTSLRIGGGSFVDVVADLGTLAILGRTCTLADLQAIWTAKEYLGPWRYMVDTYGVTNYVVFGASIPGTVVDETNAAVASTWLVAGLSNTGPSGGAPVAPTAWVYMDSSRAFGAGATQVFGDDPDVSRPLWVNTSGGTAALYVSHDAETFFTRTGVAGAAAVGGIPGPSSAMLAMYAGLAAAGNGSHALIVASNSRAVRRPSAGGQTLPERHSEAYIADNKAIVKGILNGRVWLSSSEATKAFGLAIAQGATVQNSGTTQNVQTATGWTDFTRAWTGGDSTGGGVSQGMGLALTTASASMALKFTPEGGSLFTEDRPLHVRYHVLRYPGCVPNLLYRRTKSDTQNTGTDIDGADITFGGLNTARVQYTFLTATDSWTSGTRTLVVARNLVADGVVVGDLAVNGSLISAGEIESISWNGSVTTMVLKHVLGQTPLNTHIFSFGPWSTTVIEADFPAIEPADPEINRGLLIKAPASIPAGSQGPVILSIDAWTTGVDGLVIGHAGYSGNGYQNQLTDIWTGGIANFYRKMFDDTKPLSEFKSWNVFLHHADQQVASPGLTNYGALVKATIPRVSVAHMGDQVHAVDADMINWDTFVLAQTGTLGVTTTNSPRLGSLKEQWAAGHRTDTAHPTALGHLRLAQANKEIAGPLATLQNRTSAAGGGSGIGLILSMSAAAMIAQMLDTDETALEMQ